MARLSSASTESDCVPAMVPFHWEAAPGRPAPGRPAVPDQIIDAPKLPFPPGKRPKDGFYLPFPRPARQSPHLHNEAAGVHSSSRERRPFNLQFPGSAKKSFFTSQKPRKSSDDTHAVLDIFSPVSGHRFGSRITRRMLVEFQKRRSQCLGGYMSHGRKGSSSQNQHHTGRRLDSNEEIQEPYPTPTQSAASGSPLSSSSSHGHGRTERNSTAAGARKQSQVIGSSRFMASMLMSLCPAESDHESDEAEASNAQDEITDDCRDSFSFYGHMTTPRARVSSPDAFFQPLQTGIVVDPASPTVMMTSREERTRAWVDMSTDMSRCMSKSLHKEPPIARPIANMQCEYCGGTKLLQPRISHRTDNFANKSARKFDQSFAFPDHK